MPQDMQRRITFNTLSRVSIPAIRRSSNSVTSVEKVGVAKPKSDIVKGGRASLAWLTGKKLPGLSAIDHD